MQQLQCGPVIFREETVFRKEIKYEEPDTINLSLIKGKRDYSRCTICHEIKKQDDKLCAVVTVDGAWIHILEPKLFIPPVEVARVFQQMPVRENFEWLN